MELIPRKNSNGTGESPIVRTSSLPRPASNGNNGKTVSNAGGPIRRSQSSNAKPVTSKRNNGETDVSNPDYRLNDEEMKIWSASVAGAGLAAGVLLSPLTMLRPYKSKIVPVAAIDESWRVALGPKFFTYHQSEREAVVVHLCLHVVCNHSSRARIAGHNNKEWSSEASDLEINQLVMSMRRLRLPPGSVYPKVQGAPDDWKLVDVPAGKTMEQYYQIIKDANGGDDAQQGNGPSESSQSVSGGLNIPGMMSGMGTGASDSPSDESSDGSEGASSNGNDGSQSSAVMQGNPSANGNANKQNGNSNNRNGQSSGNSRKGEDSNRGQSDRNGSNGNNDRNGDGRDGDDTDGSRDGACNENMMDSMESEADKAGVMKVYADSRVGAIEDMTKAVEKRMDVLGKPGTSSMDKQFLVMFNKVMFPPHVDWKRVLRNVATGIMSKQAYKKTEYSFKRINRRGSAFMKDGVFPSMIGYCPRVVMAIDTSASRDDNQQFKMDIANAQEIMKSISRGGKDMFSAFCVDTTVKKIQPVNRVEDIDFTGGGGTDMSVAFQYVSDLPRRRRADVMVLCTDGGFDWAKCAAVWPKNVKVIILITDEYYLRPGKIPEWVWDEAKIIDASTMGDVPRR